MIITGDNEFADFFSKLEAVGHTTMMVFRKIEDQASCSTVIRKTVHICWDDWRSFLGLPDKKVAKAMKDCGIILKRG